MRICIALEFITIVVLSALDWVDSSEFGLGLALCAACTLFTSYALFYWLRRARGSSTAAAAILVFSALFISEIELYLVTFIPSYAGKLIAAALALSQYPCMVWARNKTQPHDLNIPLAADERAQVEDGADYFGFTKTMIKSVQFLTATAIGIGFLSLVIGLLRGYPDGDSIVFTLPTRTAYGFLTLVICVVVIEFVLAGRKRVMTVGAFLIMESLASLTLLCYAAFPGALDIGAVFTTTLNAFMVGFVWYIIIAFMSYGWRDPYYYAMAGWFVAFGARAIARVALLLIYQISTNDILMHAIMGTLIVVSTQVIFMQFLGIARSSEKESEHEAAEETASKPLTRLMGLDEGASLAVQRQAAMRHSAEIMGKQFLLSEREVDVLALYALGFTQKRVAEELFISPGTAHAHIKRIYAKCDMHSRQEILDYIEQYAS